MFQLYMKLTSQRLLVNCSLKCELTLFSPYLVFLIVRSDKEIIFSTTIQENPLTSSFKETRIRLLIRPRALQDVSNVDTSVEWFGQKQNFPIGIAPTAFQRMAHRDGELATVRGLRAHFLLY